VGRCRRREQTGNDPHHNPCEEHHFVCGCPRRRKKGALSNQIVSSLISQQKDAEISPFLFSNFNWPFLIKVGAKLADARSAELVSAEAVSKEGILFYMFEFKNEAKGMRELYQVCVCVLFQTHFERPVCIFCLVFIVRLPHQLLR
jgi:hypothetical protein